MTQAFDPDAAASPGSGIFGLPHTYADAGIILVPAPFDATASYGAGASRGPAAIRQASAQVDLYDMQFGHIYRAGIFMLPEDERIHRESAAARTLAEPIIARGGAGPDDAAAVERINGAGQVVNTITHEAFRSILEAGKAPGLVGGDHSTPFGPIRACAEHVAMSHPEGLGVLHLDAHMDLRDAFEGFTWSHASIMRNVLERIPGVTRLVQIGLRDYGHGELGYAKVQADRVHTHFDLDWAKRRDGDQAGTRTSFGALCRQAVAPLPEQVYVSFDIDALDPSLCPHTGTPVPGGLTFNQACVLLETVAKSGRKVVGFDLVEVTPDPDEAEPDWDANVGARILYKLCGLVR